MDTPLQALERAIRLLGSQEAFAQALEVKSPSVSEWRKRRRVPAERCIPIERITDRQVRREELRPDLWGPESHA